MIGVCLIPYASHCAKYAKGKVGSASAAAKYAAATPAEGFSISEEKPYAEVGHRSSSRM
jgi:mannose-6-phosphate isomerase